MPLTGNGCGQCGNAPYAPPPIPMGCSPCCPKPPNLAPLNLETVCGQKAYSTSHVFKGLAPGNPPVVLSLISLLQQSRTGNMGIYSVDIDVRISENGVMLKRGNGVDIIYEGGSRSWEGKNDGLGKVCSATEFELTLVEGDEVVINWTEIRAQANG